MSEPKTHILKLDNGAVEALKMTLGAPGWYDDPATAYRAGQILEMPELDLVAPPVAEAAELWRKVPLTIELSERLRATAKKCIEAYLKKGQLGINRHSMALMRELGLAPED